VEEAEARVRERGEPRTPDELWHWLRRVLDLELVRAPVEQGHAAPFDYLCHAFFGAPPSPDDKPEDCIVWSNRGGGKTFYAAVATLLDMLYKPGVQVKILGGSLDQSLRVHEHLRMLLERSGCSEDVEGKPTLRRIRFTNGSSVEMLAQSQTSVRGTRPTILRCDEVDLFDPDIWRAAQLTVRSHARAPRPVRARIEALSTMHRVGGLMESLVNETAAPGADGPASSARTLFKWGVIDVLEPCPDERSCNRCALFPECEGRAKLARPGKGHFLIDDALALRERVDEETWQTEMLCLRPSRRDTVFPSFDPARHVLEFEPPEWTRRGSTMPAPSTELFVAGMDFGYRAPTVILWAHVTADGVVRVVDEHVASEEVLAKHLDVIIGGGPRGWTRPAWLAIDPAGESYEFQTGRSAAGVLRTAGVAVKARRSNVEQGLHLIRARLGRANQQGHGPARLFIHSRCTRLIESMRRYRYRDPSPVPRDIEQPLKDGNDHAVDALRYLVMVLDAGWTTHDVNYVLPRTTSR